MVSCSTSVKAWFSAAMASPGASLAAGTRALKPLVATTLPELTLISLAKISISAEARPSARRSGRRAISVARAYCPVEALTALTAPEFWKSRSCAPAPGAAGDRSRRCPCSRTLGRPAAAPSGGWCRAHARRSARRRRAARARDSAGGEGARRHEVIGGRRPSTGRQGAADEPQAQHACSQRWRRSRHDRSPPV